MKRFLITALADRVRGRRISRVRAAGASAMVGLGAAAASYRALRSGN
jgi:hypothetical protein